MKMHRRTIHNKTWCICLLTRRFPGFELCLKLCLKSLKPKGGMGILKLPDGYRLQHLSPRFVSSFKFITFSCFSVNLFNFDLALSDMDGLFVHLFTAIKLIFFDLPLHLRC